MKWYVIKDKTKFLFKLVKAWYNIPDGWYCRRDDCVCPYLNTHKMLDVPFEDKQELCEHYCEYLNRPLDHTKGFNEDGEPYWEDKECDINPVEYDSNYLPQ